MHSGQIVHCTTQGGISLIKNKRTLTTMKLNSEIKKRNKLMALLLIVIVLLSSSTFFVSAAQTDVDETGRFYFTYNGTYGPNVYFETDYFRNIKNSSYRREWSVLRNETFEYVSDLLDRHNYYVNPQAQDTSSNAKSVLSMLSVLTSDDANKDDDSNKKLAEKYIKQWKNMQRQLESVIHETQVCCSYGEEQPKYATGEKVKAANYQTLKSDASNVSEKLENIMFNIKTSYSEAKYNANAAAQKRANGLFNVANKLWGYLGKILKTLGLGSSNSNNFLGISLTTGAMKSIANSISAITKTCAYCILIVLFGLNLTSTALKFDMMSVEGVVRVLGGLIIGKRWVDVSINVCGYILNIVNDMNKQIFNTLVTNNYGGLTLSSNFVSKNEVQNSFWDFLGSLINWLGGIFWQLPYMILAIVIIVAIIIVIIKIITRNFELTCLMALSPIFFAALANEETKAYFKKFMGAFLSTALYITYMVIVYAVGSEWITQLSDPSQVTGFAQACLVILPRCIIILGICRVMMKPPKVLLSLVD